MFSTQLSFPFCPPIELRFGKETEGFSTHMFLSYFFLTGFFPINLLCAQSYVDAYFFEKLN